MLNENPKGNEQTSKEDEATPQTPQETQVEETTEKTTPTTEKSPVEEVDYKKKFGESTAENQRISKESVEDKEKIADLETKLADANETPTDEELAKKYPNWGMLSETEKAEIRNTDENEKRLRKLEEKQAWEDEFRTLVTTDEFSSLKDKEDEFKKFAYKFPSSVDLTTLAKSFLYENPAPSTEEPTEETPRKGNEEPTGGTEQAPSSEMTTEDATRIRDENPELYKKLLLEGKFKKLK